MAIDELDETLYPPYSREPAPRLTVLDALRRQVGVAMLPVIVLVGVALAVGMTRSPEYTSEARLNVGGLTLTEQSAEDYSYAVQALAVAYARAIDATAIVTPASRATRTPPDEVTNRVSAHPVQGSGVIRVLATGSDATEAEQLADAAAAALRDYADELNSGREAGDELRARFSSASLEFRAALEALAGAPPGSTSRRRLQSRVDLARLEKRTLGFLYGQSQVGQATSGLVQQLAPAAEAESDRGDVLVDLLVAAAIAGLLIGLGLAVLRANALSRRRLSGL